MAYQRAAPSVDRGFRADLTFQYSGVIARRLAALTRTPEWIFAHTDAFPIVHAREAGDSILLPIGNLFNGRP